MCVFIKAEYPRIDTPYPNSINRAIDRLVDFNSNKSVNLDKLFLFIFLFFLFVWKILNRINFPTRTFFFLVVSIYRVCMLRLACVIKKPCTSNSNSEFMVRRHKATQVFF